MPENNTRTYQNVSPVAAEKFLAAAIAGGFHTEPAAVDVSFAGPFAITRDVLGSPLTFSVFYNPNGQSVTITLEEHSFLLSKDFIFSKIDSFVAAAAQPNELMPDMSVWSNACRPHFRIGHMITGNPSFAAHEDRVQARSFKPANIKKYYGIKGDGEGQTIAFIELGGSIYGSDLYAAGIDPSLVTSVSVDGATPQPGDADGEVALDIQVAHGVAPKAKKVVYFAPNTPQGFIDAVKQAYADLGGYCPTCVAAGDQGSTDGETGNAVDFPASAPYAIACGGTRLTGSVETVWNDLSSENGATGGGVSAKFAVPAWQNGLTSLTADGKRSELTGRGVPDVAANADPLSGYMIWVNGQKVTVGGTSAVAPLMAGALACAGYNTVSISWGMPEDQWDDASSAALAQLIEDNAAAGNVLPIFYTSGAFKDVTADGNNGGYAVSSGWDACTGLGSPIGPKLHDALVKS